MANFDLSNQNDDMNEGLTSNTNVNNFDNEGLTSKPVTQTTGTLSTEKPVETVKTETLSTVTHTNNTRSNTNSRIKCPACNSSDIEYVIRTEEKKKNVPLICLTLFFIWPVGLYLLLKKDTKSRQVRKCKNCGREF